MAALAARKLTAAAGRRSFWASRNRAQASRISTAPLPMGAANSPSTKDQLFTVGRPPLRRVLLIPLTRATPEGSHRGIWA